METFSTREIKNHHMPQIDMLKLQGTEGADSFSKRVNKRIAEIAVADGEIKEIRYLPSGTVVILYEVATPAPSAE